MSAVTAFTGGGTPDPGAQLSFAAAVNADRQFRDPASDVVAEARESDDTNEEFSDATAEQAEARPPAPPEDPFGRGGRLDVLA